MSTQRLKLLNEQFETPLAAVISEVKGVSRSEAQRLMKSGGVKLYSVTVSLPECKYVYLTIDTITDPKSVLTCTEDDLFILKVGKRDFFELSSLLGDLFAQKLA